MRRRLLSQEDRDFITLWRPHQYVSCLAKAINVHPSVVDSYCYRHKLDGPHGRVAWLSQDKRMGYRNPRRPRDRKVMGSEHAAFLRQWRPYQSAKDLAAALELPVLVVRQWCIHQKLRGPRSQTAAWHARQMVRWEVNDLSDGDHAWILAERTRYYLDDLAEMVGVEIATVKKICWEKRVWGPKHWVWR